MTHRTPRQLRQIIGLAERQMLRELAQEVPCRDCQAQIGVPCVGVDGQPLARVDHISRITDARKTRDQEEPPCPTPPRPHPTNPTPW